MKPLDPTDIINVEAMTKTTELEMKQIKERMEEAWKRSMKKI